MNKKKKFSKGDPVLARANPENYHANEMLVTKTGKSQA